jgi:hypothetical protein
MTQQKAREWVLTELGCGDPVYVTGPAIEEGAKIHVVEHSALEAEQAKVRRLREVLENLVTEMQVFLNVSQKIHFPDAREAQQKAKEALKEIGE